MRWSRYDAAMMARRAPKGKAPQCRLQRFTEHARHVFNLVKEQIVLQRNGQQQQQKKGKKTP
jgi:hypothetical protein